MCHLLHSLYSKISVPYVAVSSKFITSAFLTVPPSKEEFLINTDLYIEDAKPKKASRPSQETEDDVSEDSKVAVSN